MPASRKRQTFKEKRRKTHKADKLSLTSGETHTPVPRSVVETGVVMLPKETAKVDNLAEMTEKRAGMPNFPENTGKEEPIKNQDLSEARKEKQSLSTTRESLSRPSEGRTGQEPIIVDSKDDNSDEWCDCSSDGASNASEDDEYEARDADNEHMRKAPAKKKIEKTIRYMKSFYSTNKNMHFQEVSVKRLRGCDDYVSWSVGIELVLRMHRLWDLAIDAIEPLPEHHNLFALYDHMVTVAIGIVWNNVSQSIREDRCFLRGVKMRSIDEMMFHLWVHYGTVPPPTSDDSDFATD
ncbi:hypothetical protein N7462_010138 [Penicillium macrosclerotiorum]|uniref:uncharacterized protein n=1 Tax=Penicillium macrosclerotiorum TaxID=303699 RepID=UPI0025492548|nr:uncharacterized protein N7462_010138 [Penicillium macrosclerotiorum]KAJ5669068.1 hypothetical protein N7462_010138 [Penicillium macrosclerotiorum]